MADEKVVIELDVQLDNGAIGKATGVIEAKLKQSGGKAGKTAGDSFGRTFSGAVSSFLGNIGAVAFSRALGGIKNTLGGVVGAASKLEVFESQFATILGSAGAAQKQLKELQEFAATTPFQIDGLALATRQLLSFGVEQEKVVGTLSQLGDIAAGVGANIDELTIPYGRLISTQKLTLVELDKFADRGVNVYQQLANQTGRSIGQIRDDISKGRVDFEEFTKAIDSFTSEGGTFFEGAARQSQTLAGLFSTLRDNIFNLQGTIGTTFQNALKQVTRDLITFVQTTTKFIKDNSVEIINSFINIGKGINDFVILPAMIIKDTFTLAFLGLRNAVQETVNFLVNTTLAAAKKLNFGGAFDGFISELEGVKEITNSTTQEFRDSFGEAFDGAFNTDFNAKAEEYLENLRATALQSNEIVATFTKPDILPDKEETEEKVNGLTALFGSLNVSFKNNSKAMADTSKKLAATFKSTLVNGIVGGVQNIVKSIMSGQDAFKNFGNFILQTLGNLATQFGTVLIAAGLGVDALKKLGGSAAVAAGVGLVALGAVLSSVSAGGDSTPTASGSSGDTSFGIGDDGTSFDEDEPELVQDNVSVTVNIQGDILDSDESGGRIVDLINQAVDGEGVSIRRNAIA